MKKNQLSKAFKIITTATLISLLSAGSVFAADGDIYNNDGTSFVERSNYLDDFSKVKQAVLNQEEYSYEFSGKIYHLSTIAERTANMFGDAFNTALTGITKDTTVPSQTVEEFTGEQQGDFVVLSIT